MAHKDKKQIALYVTASEDAKIIHYSQQQGTSKQKLLSAILNEWFKAQEKK